jgi:anti-sigma regulatory factor (Ser/Thr protein kinase)
MSRPIVLKNDPSEIHRLTQEVRQFAKDHGLAQEVVNDLRLALEEVFSNIVTYAFKDQEEHLITVSMGIRDDVFQAEIRDDGLPFDPTRFYPGDMEKPFEDREIGGMGIHLVRSVMDGVEYRSEKGYNILVISKRVTGPGPGSWKP